jgi:zinc transport system substrate-binding protein
MRRTGLLVTTLMLLAASCGRDDPPEAPGVRPTRAVPEVWTTFYPTTYFTQRLAGDLVKVVCPLPQDEDPAFWQPDAKTLQGYQAADLIVINGAGFEAWVGKASLPTGRVVNASKSFEKEFLKLEGSVTHTHAGSGQAHTHEGIDGHTWFDPVNAKAQAHAILRGLVLLLPATSAVFEANAPVLDRDLDGLDAAFRALGKLPEGQHLYVSHPAWNYAARRYGWPTVSFVLDPASPLSDADAAKLKTSKTEKPGTYVLWEDEPVAALRERLQAGFGLTSLVVPPCETEPAEDRAPKRDWLARMQANVETLRAAFATK